MIARDEDQANSPNMAKTIAFTRDNFEWMVAERQTLKEKEGAVPSWARLVNICMAYYREALAANGASPSTDQTVRLTPVPTGKRKRFARPA